MVAVVCTPSWRSFCCLLMCASGTNQARIAAMLRNLALFYAKDASALFMVRVAQGLLHTGKGSITLCPVHTERSLVSPTGLAGLLATLTAVMDSQNGVCVCVCVCVYVCVCVFGGVCVCVCVCVCVWRLSLQRWLCWADWFAGPALTRQCCCAMATTIFSTWHWPCTRASSARWIRTSSPSPPPCAWVRLLTLSHRPVRLHLLDIATVMHGRALSL